MPPHHQPSPRHRPTRVLRGAIAFATTVALLTGCTPDPTPTPTPTPLFATEDDAYTAAEQVYRDYNDASNDARTPGSTAKPQSFLTGSALDGFLRGQDLLRRNDLHLTGESTIVSFIREDVRITSVTATVDLTICFDLSTTRVLDVSGQDVTPLDRPNLVAQRASMTGDANSFVINSEAEGDPASCTDR